MERPALNRDRVQGRKTDGADVPQPPAPRPPSKHTAEHKLSGKRLPKGKVQLLVYISEDVYRRLISVAPNLYGKNHGAISFVVEEALKQYLYPLGASDVKLNPRMSIRRVYEQVKAKIREILKSPFTPAFVPEKILDMAIRETRGPTVVERWKGFFVQEGLIKFVDGNPPNRTVELL